MNNSEKEQERVWDSLAESWHSFRQRPQKEIGIFLKKLSENWPKGKVLDIGCGNCRNLLPFSYNDFDCYGIDSSRKMLEFAAKHIKKHMMKVKLKKAYATSLLFSSNFFDYVLCASMLHNLGKEERTKALEEIKRVLKPKGKAVIIVWNKLQARFLFKKKDLMIAWYKKGKKYERYYHLFTTFELKRLLKKEGFKISQSNMLGKNLMFIISKERQ